MADRYLHLTRTAPGRFLTRRLGLPQPHPLRRWSADAPALDGPLLRLTAGNSALREPLSDAGLPLTVPDEGPAGRQSPAALILDATGVTSAAGLAEVHSALHPAVRSLGTGGRVVVLGSPLSADDHHQAAAQQALEGFTRSLGKELGRGRTANLVRLTAPAAAASTLRFLLSPKSAYISGQVIEIAGRAVDKVHVADEERAAGDDPARPLAGRTALVTGAARGIGAAVAETLALDGADVLCLDVPEAEADLRATADHIGGTALTLDITAADAAERITAALPGGLGILVHNAGITRDRRLVNMPADRWSSVLDVNLTAVLDITDALLKAGVVGDGGRIVATSSIAGIAGNTGQTNYAASKAGIIGLVRSLAPRVADRGITVNAVAPGFIETRMTAAVPLLVREAGRRMNSLAQGGLPVDVAEATAWFAHPGSGAVSGQVLRVCGQSLLGA
ncbi:3-oxoacyl-ACP reductase [Streptomyces sp. NBC_01167]|uniref:3-oxoacyl-ACP reductase n=1 Tax=Streptomyces sp. NBC_01167 TaxID=2903756 RepID=UPI003869276B|nr:3-oxoacyl-ACP reductase [Streptomyces sp. NBC_01167]